MNERDLVIHRWNQYMATRYGRWPKGVRAERRRKWLEVKHLAKKFGLKIG